MACPFQTNLKGMDKLGLANGKLASLGRTAALSAFLAPPITRCAFNLARRGAVACGLRKLKAKSTTAPTAAGQQASGRHTLGRLRVLLDGVEVHGLVDIGRIRVDDAHGLLVLGHGDLALDDV